MAARDVLKNLNVFVNGIGYAGQVEDYTPPKLVLKTEEFKGGGMFAPLELTMGMEKLDCEFTLICQDATVIGDFGVVEGNQLPFTIRGHLESFDGTTTGLVQNITGKFLEIDRGTWKAGEKAFLKCKVAISYFKETRGALVIYEIDVENMIYIVNGVDLLAGVRANLGM